MMIGQFRAVSAVLAAAILATPAVAYAQATDIGQREYANGCAVCHGPGMKGDGPLAAQLKKPVPDLTRISKDNMGVFPFARIYDVIDGRQAVATHGPREMPVWGAQYSKEVPGWYFGFGPKEVESLVQGRILALIGYIYSVQEK